MSCGHRSTRYEVSAAFYNQSIENERVFQQLKLYMDEKSGVVNKHTNDCGTCEYNDGKKCSFDMLEFETPEAKDCTYYAIKRNAKHPLGNKVYRFSIVLLLVRYMLAHLLHN